MRQPAPNGYLSDSSALEDGLRLGGAGIWRWQIDSERLEWTANLESVHKLPPGSFDGTLASFQQDLHPDDAPSVWQKIKASIDSGEAYRAVYRTAPRPNEREAWIETSGGVTTDPDGSRFLTGICLDVSERVRNERQLERRLRQQHAVAHFGTFALNEVSFQSVLEEAVRVAAEVLQVPLTKILEFSDSAEHLLLRAGLGWADGLVGHGKVGIDLASQAGYTLMSQEPVIVTDLPSETRFSGPQLLHDHKVQSGISVVIPGSTSRPYGVFGIHARDHRDFDQTDAEFLQSLANIVAGAARQFAAADHQILLVREMAHRAGNLMQLVSSIAAQTFKDNPDMFIARQSFNERLSALARANFVVARGGWKFTRFTELVEEALKPFGGRILIEGRDALLPPDLCFDMGLVLHELATNSVKYGALGKDDGTVRVNWSFVSRADGFRLFRLQWSDPEANSVPPQKGTGFGSKLMGALIEIKWGGTVVIANTSPFEVTLEVPITE